ncbi:putative nicotinate-nucleotide adenylyltransferase [Syntrophobacter sp. SbD2]|nr:putative nicotinate-nucleotide adenylyltransferase [Syntrophobacter sp. SbD2]
MPLRLGVFGGTFDPVHLGHLRAAQEALDILGLDEMLFVPVAVAPHKPARQILLFENRWRMLQLALAGNARFRLSDLEKRMPGKSYTVHSLKQLREENPGAELFFLVGSDAFFEMDTWYEFKGIFRLAGIVVLCRSECCENEILQFVSKRVSELYRIVPENREIRHPVLCSVYSIANTRMDISSTRIRELASEGRSVRYLVPDNVWSYIAENGLYPKALGRPHCELARKTDA